MGEVFLSSIILLSFFFWGLITNPALADQPIFPSPMPDLRNRANTWFDGVNRCSANNDAFRCCLLDNGSVCDSTTSNPDCSLPSRDKYSSSKYCFWNGISDETRDDSTNPPGYTGNSYVGQTVRIPSNINRITRIYFDAVWRGCGGTSGPYTNGFTGEIRVYRGIRREQNINSLPVSSADILNPSSPHYDPNLIAVANASVSLGDQIDAFPTGVTFDPPIPVIPGEKIYFELYSTEDLHEGVRNGVPGACDGILRLPVHDWNNNYWSGVSTDAYFGTAQYDDYYSYYAKSTDANLSYPLRGWNSVDLAWVRVFGENVPLTASCSVNPTSTFIKQDVFWSASYSGGSGAVSYSWTGTDGLTGTSQSLAWSYNSPGTKTGTVSITRGAETATANCSTSATIYDLLSATCSTSPNPGIINQTINWTSNVTGGSGSYTYLWAGDVSSSSPSTTTTFSWYGLYSSTLLVSSSDGQSTNTNCSVVINSPPTINSLRVVNSSSSQTTFSGLPQTSGLATDEGGSNWLNPLNITVNTTPGNSTITNYYVAFYDQALGRIDEPASFLSEVQSRLNTDPKAGFLLRYTSSGNYYVWDPSLNSGNGNWQDITELALYGWQICGLNAGIRDCDNQSFYRVYPLTSLPSWKIDFYRTFGSKNLYTAAYVTDSNNLLDFEANCTTDSSTCTLLLQ